MDPRLRALAAAVEQGAPGHPVVLIIGPWVAQGRVTSSVEFLERSVNEIALEQVAAMPHAQRRKIETEEDTASWQGILANVHQMTMPIRSAEEGESLCLADVTFSGPIGTLSTAVSRVPLDSIDAWWIARHKFQPVKFSGGGVGVSF